MYKDVQLRHRLLCVAKSAQPEQYNTEKYLGREEMAPSHVQLVCSSEDCRETSWLVQWPCFLLMIAVALFVKQSKTEQKRGHASTCINRCFAPVTWGG